MKEFIKVIFFMKDRKTCVHENRVPAITFGKHAIFETENYSEEELKTFFQIFEYFDFGSGETYVYIENEDDIKKFSIALTVLQKIGHKIKMVFKGAEEKNYIPYKFEFNSENKIIQPIIFPGELHRQLRNLNDAISNGCGKEYKNIHQLKETVESHLKQIDSKTGLYKTYVEEIEKIYRR